MFLGKNVVLASYCTNPFKVKISKSKQIDQENVTPSIMYWHVSKTRHCNFSVKSSFLSGISYWNFKTLKD